MSNLHIVMPAKAGIYVFSACHTDGQQVVDAGLRRHDKEAYIS